MKRSILLLLVIVAIALPLALSAGADTMPTREAAPAMPSPGPAVRAGAAPYLQALSLRSIDSATIRATWDSNDPPYQVECFATKGEALLSYFNEEDTPASFIDSDVYRGVTTNECYAGFSKDEVYGMFSLFPNTEYTVRVTSNSGLVIEKSIKQKKASAYSEYGAKMRVYLLKPQFQSSADFDQASIDRDLFRYFQANEIDRKLSLETARNTGIHALLTTTVTYRSPTPEHSAFIRFFLRFPDGGIAKIYNFYTNLYMFDSAPANFTWYSPWMQVDVSGVNIRQTGDYTLEVYMDDDLAAKTTITVY